MGAQISTTIDTHIKDITRNSMSKSINNIKKKQMKQIKIFKK